MAADLAPEAKSLVAIRPFKPADDPPRRPAPARPAKPDPARKWLDRATAHWGAVPIVPIVPLASSSGLPSPTPAPVPIVPIVPKSPPPPAAEAIDTIGTIGTVGGLVIYIDPQERAAIAEHDGGVPSCFADGFAAFQAEHPENADAMNDAGAFLDKWGRLATSLGWTPEDLFSADPPGLCRILAARRVVALDAKGATLSDRTRVSRRALSNPISTPKASQPRRFTKGAQ